VTRTAQLAVLLSAAGGLLLTGRGSAASARLRAAGLRRASSAGGPGSPGGFGSPVTAPPDWVPRLCAVGAGVAALTGRGALAAVLVVAAAATWLPGRRAADARRRAQRVTAHDLPRVADLLATCLEAGLPVPDAAAMVGAAVAGPLGSAVERAGLALRAGVSPRVAWSIAGPAWSRLAVALERGSSSGAPLAALLRAVADDERDRARWAAEAAAQRAGVRAIGPLVVCFLPAFVLVGVVPVVGGIAGQVVSDLG